MNHRLLTLLTMFATLTLTLAIAPMPSSNASAPDGEIPYKWTYSLPAKGCPWSAADKDCHYGSPVLADLTGDGLPDIVAVTNNGHVVAVRNTGALLWDVDVAPFFGMAANTDEIGSSPAVDDLDGDGWPEVVVGVGSIYPDVCTRGGVIVLDRNGRVRPGWPRLADDRSAPAGCPDTIFSSPTIGDLDNDGKKEIVAGGFDFRVYAWRADGSLLPGFPPDSAHSARFPNEPELKGRLADTIWSSPTLADLNRDGYLEIILATDEGNRPPGWSCPYRLPAGWRPDYCGGSLYVLDRFGRLLPGFPKYILESMASSPAVVDLDGDGWLDIVVGTGPFYYDHSPDHPTQGFRVYAWDHNGADLRGWEGGKAVGGPTPASPAIGDLDGDGKPEVVMATYNPERKLYAWRASGQAVAGFPMTPTTERGATLATFDAPSSFVLADYNGDGKMEIFLNEGWAVAVVDGNGQQITATSYPSSKPLYFTSGSLINNPAVGDIDGDGKLELVAANSRLTVWDLPQSTNTKADWPMFRRNAAHAATVGQPSPIVREPDVRAFVRRFYQQCLNREPDQAGWDNWTSALMDGSLSGAALAEAFIFSKEFVNRQTSNAEFLNIMYRAFFNREPDSGGYNTWLSALNKGTSREEVLKGFTHSQEFANLCDAYGIQPMTQRERIEAFVTRFYQQCLNRQPDAGGLKTWTDSLLSGAQTGADVAHGFIFSQEFTNRNTSNAEFLTIMYRAFFAREPDSGGYNTWLNALKGGTSRADVLNGFTHSTEFANLCRLYGIQPF